MSTLQDNPGIWSIKETDSRYEKCRNITEEIYKRINITFQIKQLETAAQSDVSEQSDQIDSNELSNETDLFACDKTSISSSTEPERPKLEPPVTGKFINNNNNEEKLKKPAVVCKRPRKRFRKKIKKRQSQQRSESDASSDEALPLSRMLDANARRAGPPRAAAGPRVPQVRLVDVLGKDLKPKTQPSDKKSTKKEPVDQTEVPAQKPESKEETIDKPAVLSLSMGKEDKMGLELRGCSMCSLSFRGERGLRRHMTMSHIISPTKNERATKP